jgi:hypothetical protein
MFTTFNKILMEFISSHIAKRDDKEFICIVNVAMKRVVKIRKNDTCVGSRTQIR